MRPIAAFLLCLALWPTVASAADTPEAFVERTSNEAITILGDAGIDHATKLERLEAMLERHCDFGVLSKLVLAANYRTFSEPQREEFAVLLKRYLSATYGDQIDDYAGETVEIVGSRPEARGDVTVHTKIRRRAGADLVVDYRLRPSGDEWRLIDVIGEGVSLVANLRSQFQEILTRGGPERLLAVLREKSASPGSSAGSGLPLTPPS